MPKVRTIDLNVVREVRRRLRRLADEHPQLIGPSAPHNRAGWIAALQEEERMAATSVVSFRADAELLARIDQHADRLSKLAAGIPITRADVSKLLVERGLVAMDAEAHAQSEMGKRNAQVHAARVADPSRGRSRRPKK